MGVRTPMHWTGLLVLLNGSFVAAAQPEARKSGNAPQIVAAVLVEHHIVALGENHGHQQFHSWLLDLLRTPEIGAVVDDLVVEWANGRHQGLLDRYVAGEEIDERELRRLWLDTVSSPSPVWDPPVYEEFFRGVRAINRERTDGRAYRVVAGGAPVDWRVVNSATDLRVFGTTSRHLFEVTVEEVLQRGRRALFVAGAAHVSFANMRRNTSRGVVRAEVTPIAELELHYPGSVFAVRSMGRAGPAYRAESVSAFPGDIVPLTADLAELQASGVTLMRNSDGRPFTLYGDQTLSDMVDAIVYWGPAEDFRASEPDPCRYADPVWWGELNRRAEALSGRPLPEDWRTGCDEPSQGK